MQIAGLAPHVLGHVGGKRDHVVLHFFFDFQDALDV